MAEQKYHQDELVPPSFLKEGYLVNVFRQVEDDPDLHVINYDVKPGSSVGDHYASIMFKISVSYGSRGKIVIDRRFVLKTMPEAEGQKRDILEKSPAFKNETIMYTQTLKAMEEVLQQHGEKTWWPKLVYSHSSPYVLIFDDLTVEKYQVIYDPLDFEELKMVIDKTAKFHALSLVLLENGHTMLTEFESGFNSAMKDMFKPMGLHLRTIGKIVESWEGFEEIGKKIIQTGPELAAKFLNVDKTPRDDRFFVLNHGDFHLRNLMFQKTDEGNISNIMFLDFQIPVYFSAGFDLIGLLNTMGTPAVRRRSPEVLKRYHEQLVMNLKTYGYHGRIPSAVDIHMEMLRNSHYDAFSSILGIPMFMIKGMDLAELFSTDQDGPAVAGIKKAYNDPQFIADIKPIIYSFYNRGVFDE